MRSDDGRRSKRREDDTVQTKLRQASERCRRITERCAAVTRSGLRQPTSGPIEHVEIERVRGIGLPKRESAPPQDPISRLIALVMRDRRKG